MSKQLNTELPDETFLDLDRYLEITGKTRKRAVKDALDKEFKTIFGR